MSEEQKTAPLSTRERLQKTLRDRAAAIKCCHAEVYTVPRVRTLINFLCGLAAVGLLVATIVVGYDSPAMLGCLIPGLVMIVVTLVMYIIMKFSHTPMSFLQCLVKTKERTYTFQAISRDRAVYSDGESIVEYNKLDAIKLDEVYCPEMKNDFFADMSVTMRIGKVDTETFYGTTEVDGKTKKCRIVFRNGVPESGKVGARRMHYYAVNDANEKLGLPAALKDAVKSFGVEWQSDVPGVRLISGFEPKEKK